MQQTPYTDDIFWCSFSWHFKGWAELDLLVDFTPQKTSTLLIIKKQQPILHPAFSKNNVPLKENYES